MLNRPHITVNGNLTEDPKYFHTTSGQLAVEFTVAVNPRYRDRSGQWQEEDAQFWRVKVWGPSGENLLNTLHKGMNVTVVGTLRAFTWQDKTNPEITRRGYEIIPDDVAVSLRFQQARVGKVLGSGQSNGWNQHSPQTPASGAETSAEDSGEDSAAENSAS